MNVRRGRSWQRCSGRSTTSRLWRRSSRAQRPWPPSNGNVRISALLDLQMPELDGIGVVRMVKRTHLPLIAFVTAYDEYAVRAFEVNAVDYLLKPVERTRLREALNRAQERVEHSELASDQAARVSQAIDTYETTARPSRLERIPVRRRDEIILVPVAALTSIVAEGELLHLTTLKGERHTITYRLKDSGNATRPQRIRASRPRHARQRRAHRQGARDAGWHARGALVEWTEAHGEPAPVAGTQRAAAPAVAHRSFGTFVHS
ncbi:MAG: response regulator [Vicinamibacterales bacterium]